MLSSHIITLKTGRPKCLSHLLVETFFYYLSGAKLIWAPCPCRWARGFMFPYAKHAQHERAFINKTIKQKKEMLKKNILIMDNIMGPNVIKKYLRARVYFKFWFVLRSGRKFHFFVLFLAEHILEKRKQVWMISDKKKIVHNKTSIKLCKSRLKYIIQIWKPRWL